ncbi:RNA-binding protein [Kocuria sp. p3-SID1433]|uniref:Jag family protein n=1 Tax=unclassified Kocuria TaxID=2649579 RepID=UPI0021A31BA3|nr:MULTISPECIES: R3H domain-containing nucleic acid-binding protein [unclassified Kocuria]MCT1600912.1 RNA-binding protein [Kocuria sp. p3-SID1428]MCT2179127.1 RNA-binding protein [Kocuria sp. p3-SID1433]
MSENQHSEQAQDTAPEGVEVQDLEPGQKVDASAVVAGVDVPQDHEAAETPADRSALDDDDLDPLVEEGEVAADYLEELLDLADLDGDIDIEVRNGRTYLSVVTEEEGDDGLDLLVGKDGEVLEALQELVRLAVLAGTEQRSRLVLDIAGHRLARAEQLRELARRAVQSVRETGEPVHLDPLSPYERKIVHDVVAEEGMHSESEGEGPGRHIVVSANG